MLQQMTMGGLHQENNTLLGWLETLESARVARNARSSLANFVKNFLGL